MASQATIKQFYRIHSAILLHNCRFFFTFGGIDSWHRQRFLRRLPAVSQPSAVRRPPTDRP